MTYHTKNIRNVVLLGHSGAGKTTLSEAMLFESNALKRRGTIEGQNTTSDHTNIEKERGNSIFSTLMNVKWKDSKINIIDTPGYDDFVGEVASSMKVADTAAIVLNAKNGVEVGTELVWNYIQQLQTPALLVVNHVDHEKSNFEETLEQAQSRFGNKVLAVQYPLDQGTGFHKIIDALRMVMYVFPTDGGKPEKQAIPASEIEKANAMHNALVEAAAENEEGLLEKYFDAGTLSEEELAQGLTIALVKSEIYPLFCCSATHNMGSGRIMGFINDICPSPADRPAAPLADGGELPCDKDAATTIFVFKTLSEPRVGNVSYFKVYSGILKAGDELLNSNNQNSERFNQLFETNGKDRTAVPELAAGDIGVSVKLKNVATNQTLNTKGTTRSIEPIPFPEARIRVAVNPPSKNDMEKLMKALLQIAAEDPTLLVEQSKMLKQTLLHGQGELHLDIIKYRIEKVNNVLMEFEKPRIPYRETITKMATGNYRHKKQSGGSGQFGEVYMRIEPYHDGMPSPDDLNVRSEEISELPWGGKLAFCWCIVGGAIDAKYANAIKKGIMQKMEEGPLTGSPCQDIRVYIYDGKMHAVDSNDMAFMIAAAQCFKNIFPDAKPELLEPIYDLEVLCSGESMGDVMADLQTRRAIILGMEGDGHYQKILAKAPLAELYKYSSSLRSLSQGRAKFTQHFFSFQSVGSAIQKQLQKHYTETNEV